MLWCASSASRVNLQASAVDASLLCSDTLQTQQQQQHAHGHAQQSQQPADMRDNAVQAAHAALTASRTAAPHAPDNTLGTRTNAFEGLVAWFPGRSTHATATYTWTYHRGKLATRALVEKGGQKVDIIFSRPGDPLLDRLPDIGIPVLDAAWIQASLRAGYLARMAPFRLRTGSTLSSGGSGSGSNKRNSPLSQSVTADSLSPSDPGDGASNTPSSLTSPNPDSVGQPPRRTDSQQAKRASAALRSSSKEVAAPGRSKTPSRAARTSTSTASIASADLPSPNITSSSKISTRCHSACPELVCSHRTDHQVIRSSSSRKSANLSARLTGYSPPPQENTDRIPTSPEGPAHPSSTPTLQRRPSSDLPQQSHAMPARFQKLRSEIHKLTPKRSGTVYIVRPHDELESPSSAESKLKRATPDWLLSSEPDEMPNTSMSYDSVSSEPATSPNVDAGSVVPDSDSDIKDELDDYEDCNAFVDQAVMYGSNGLISASQKRRRGSEVGYLGGVEGATRPELAYKRPKLETDLEAPITSRRGSSIVYTQGPSNRLTSVEL